MLRRLYAAVPLLCLLALVAAAVLYVLRIRRLGGRIPVPTLLWAGFFALVLAALCLLCVGRLVEGDGMTFVLCSLAAMGGGMIALTRQSSFAAIERLDARGRGGRVVGEFARTSRDVVALAAGTTAAFCAMELPYNVYVLPTDPVSAAYQAFLILSLLVVLYLLFQRHGVGPAIGVFLFLLVGITEYFVIKFKGASIAASDIFAIGTAAAVGGSYIYSIDARVLLGVTSALVGIAALSFVKPSRVGSVPARIANVAGNLVAGTAIAAVVISYLMQVNIKQTYDIWPDYWNSVTQHSANGFLSTFVTEAQNLSIEEPDDYTDEEARDLVSAYAAEYDETTGSSEQRQQAVAQFDEVKPNVIVVMDEAFSDLSIFNGLGCGYEGPEFWNTGMGDSLASGAMYTSVLGTGTCNTEFEFLSNEAMLFVGEGKLVYPMYDLSEIDTLPRQFKQLGYTCTAIHPNAASNWSRDRVYPEMGFDDFLSIDDFDGAPTFHSGVSDGATFDACLDILATSNEPQFVFAVTMQNHSPYTLGNIPEELTSAYQPQDAGTSEENAELNEYLACVKASDQDIEELVSSLRELDEPTVLVIFGDHQPFLSQVYNDAYYPNEVEVVHSSRVYQTTYRIWANYDVAGNDQVNEVVDTSAPYLGAQMMNLIGAPLTDYQKALLAFRSNIPLTYGYGYMGPDGTWYASYWEGSPYWGLYQELKRMQYWHFGARL